MSIAALLVVFFIVPQTATAAQQAYTYDANGFEESKTDWNGVKVEFTRDSRGLPLTKTEAIGTDDARLTTTQWHADLHKPTQRTEPGRQTDFTYDSNGNIETKTVTDTATSEARTWTYSHSATGQLLTADGPRTDVTDTTTFSYYNCVTGGKCGQRHTATNALGHVTTFNDYDAHGNPLSITDANGVETVLTYDLRQRLKTSTVAGAKTEYDYDPAGNITRVTSPDASYLQYTWDDANRMVAIEDALFNRMEWDLDAVGNRTATRYKDASGTLRMSQTQVFDELSRLIKTIYAVSGEASYGYDKNGNRTSSVEPGGATTTSGYDALNRLISSTDAENGVTTYGYDALDNLRTVTDPANNVTTYSTNAFGDVLQLSSPDTGVTTYTVDATGNRESETDARGVTVNYQYDALNRLLSKSYTDSSLNVQYTFDQGVNGVGRLSNVSDSTGSTAYSYDARGNITEQRSSIGGELYTTSATYDDANKMLGRTYPSGRVLTYDYDVAGRLDSITHTQGTVSETLISNTSYLPFGPLTGYTLGNGTVRTVEYDLDYRIGRIADGTVLDRSYGYGADNNINLITDALIPANTQVFGYDALNRLTSAAGDYGDLGYSYDAVGNRQSFERNQSTVPYSYEANSNRLSGVGGAARTRDAVGNLTLANGNTFDYSEQGRLSAVTGLAGSIQYGHNALGQRVSKTVGASVRHYVFDTQGQLVAESNSDGSEAVEYAYLNGQPLAMWRDATAPPVKPTVPVLIAPLGSIDNGAPVYQWQALSNATKYQLHVFDRTQRTWAFKQNLVSADTCTDTQCNAQPAGWLLPESLNHLWRVRAGNAVGWGPWTANQRIDLAPSAITIAPTLIAPIGVISTGSPLFQWGIVSGATKYQLFGYDRTQRTWVLKSILQAADNCTATQCESQPDGLLLPESLNHLWRVRAGSLAGWGPWTANQRFDVLPAAPGVVTLISPNSTVNTASPSFQWLMADRALQYRVQIYDRAIGANAHFATHQAADLCDATQCSLTPAIALGINDSHRWRVRARNLAGWGPWSPMQTFGYLGAAPTVLSFGQSSSGHVEASAYQHFTLPAPDSSRAVSVRLTGLVADADLFVRFDQAADKDNYDCKSDVGGTTDEACHVSQEAGEVLHIAVHGFAATDFSLTAGGQ